MPSTPKRGMLNKHKFGWISLNSVFTKEEKMQIRCLLDTHVVDIKPPLTILCVGNGCEACSNNLYIPAKSELTSWDDTVIKHTYFQQFNANYQNQNLIEDLGLEKLTIKEIENLPDHLVALPMLRFNELKRRLVEIKKPLHIYSNTVAILLLVGGDNIDSLFGLYPVENI